MFAVKHMVLHRVHGTDTDDDMPLAVFGAADDTGMPTWQQPVDARVQPLKALIPIQIGPLSDRMRHADDRSKPV
jgi:hypothetical protein